MLEIRYNTITRELTGWWGSRFGNHEVKLKNRPNESIVTLDIPIPEKPLGAYLMMADLTGLEDNPNYMPPEPPRSTYISTIHAIDVAKARPVRVKRVWEGRDYFYDCFATQTVKDEYVAGKIKVGDYVIVHFDDIGEQIVVAKVFKSW